MNDIFIIGLNHKSAPIEIRERFTLNYDSRLEILPKFAECVEEIVLLSTCNRTEVIYSVLEEETHAKINGLVSSIGNLTRDQFNQFCYSHRHRNALTHLFRVASGLDSMIPGETQILGQVKEAFEFSFKNGFIKNNFNRIYQQMLNTAKTVRVQTGLGVGAVSVGSTAVQLARNIFESLNDKIVLLVGAGEMCEIAGDHFVADGVKRINVANRRFEKAELLARKFSGSPHSLDELDSLMITADVVLCSVSDRKQLITSQMAEKVMRARRGRPMFIIDIAVPRNVDETVNKISNIYLYNIDDLQHLVDENLRERKNEAEKGEDLVIKKVDDFLNDHGEIAGPVIQSLQERASSIKNQELEKLFSKNQDLSQAEKSNVEHTVNLIVNKILHDPIISLRRGLRNDHSSSHNVIQIFKDLFNL
jgi:glutamyl-tRNA reductase